MKLLKKLLYITLASTATTQAMQKERIPLLVPKDQAAVVEQQIDRALVAQEKINSSLLLVCDIRSCNEKINEITNNDNEVQAVKALKKHIEKQLFQTLFSLDIEYLHYYFQLFHISPMPYHWYYNTLRPCWNCYVAQGQLCNYLFKALQITLCKLEQQNNFGSKKS